MSTVEENRVSDAAELQNVLTRYIDSYEGYHQAAEVVDSTTLKEAFLEIAARRKIIVEHVATLIVRQGEKPDESGSPEAAVHRWWIRVRAKMTDEEFKATLEECVRGEKELARTIDSALEHGNLDERHAAIVAEVATELKEALRTFQSVLGR
jgi:uncharacterized protein (TIGR02284 family)